MSNNPVFTRKPRISNGEFLGHFHGYDAYAYKAIGGDAIALIGPGIGDGLDGRRVIVDWKVTRRSNSQSMAKAFDAAIEFFKNRVDDISVSPQTKMKG